MTIPTDGNYTMLKRFPAETIHMEEIFPCYLYICLIRFTSLITDGDVIWLSFAVNIARFGKVNAIEFTSAQSVFSCKSRMWCCVLNILLSSLSGSVFLWFVRSGIVFSKLGRALYLTRQHCMEVVLQEKTITE